MIPLGGFAVPSFHGAMIERGFHLPGHSLRGLVRSAARRLSLTCQGNPPLGFSQGIGHVGETGVHGVLFQPADALGEQEFA